MTHPIDRRHDRIEGLLKQLFPEQQPTEPEHPIEAVWRALPMDALLLINDRLRDLGHPHDFRVEQEITDEVVKMVAEGTLPQRYAYTPPPEPAPQVGGSNDPPSEPDPAPDPAPELEPHAPTREETPGRFGLRPVDPPVLEAPRPPDVQAGGRPVPAPAPVVQMAKLLDGCSDGKRICCRP